MVCRTRFIHTVHVYFIHTENVRWFPECAGWKAGCQEACPGALELLSGAGHWVHWLECGRRGAREPHVQGFSSDRLSQCPASLMVYGPHSPAARSSDFSLPASLRPACPPRFHLRPQGLFLETVSFFSRHPSLSWCLFTLSGPRFFRGVFGMHAISLLDGHVISASRDWSPCMFPVYTPLVP